MSLAQIRLSDRAHDFNIVGTGETLYSMNKSECWPSANAFTTTPSGHTIAEAQIADADARLQHTHQSRWYKKESGRQTTASRRKAIPIFWPQRNRMNTAG